MSKKNNKKKKSVSVSIMIKVKRVGGGKYCVTLNFVFIYVFYIRFVVF